MKPMAWPIDGPFPIPQALPKTTSRISLILLGIHVPLAAGMYLARPLATAHALGTILLGVLFLSKRRSDLAFYLLGYIAGAEVLWRICGAQTNHEFAKFAGVLLLFGIGFRQLNFRRASWAVFYFLLLMPSVLITLDELPLNLARKRLSFNLSGPLTLALAAIVFSNMKITAVQLRKFLLAFIYPMIGISTCILISLAQADQLNFNTQSNFESSAGFGPNQVSSILAMGALVSYLFYMLFLNKRLFKSPLLQRQIAIGLTALFLLQSAFTFSRSGLYMAVISILASGVILLQDADARKKFLINGIVFSLLSFFVVLPVLNRFTEGAFLQRYMETDTTGRSEILNIELQLWKKNWLLGVGPGMRVYHIDDEVASAAHTEYTRLVGEHGLLGFLALIFLIGGIGLRWTQLSDYRSRALMMALAICSGLFWATNGMRIFAPQLLVGITFATLLWRPQAVPLGPWAMMMDPEFHDPNNPDNPFPPDKDRVEG